jgi:hypothetical protein
VAVGVPVSGLDQLMVHGIDELMKWFEEYEKTNKGAHQRNSLNEKIVGLSGDPLENFANLMRG